MSETATARERPERASGATAGAGDVEVSGLLVRRSAWAPARVLMVVTGLALVRGLAVLVARILLALKRTATARVRGGAIEIESRWMILGREFRRTRTTAAIGEVGAVRFENRRRYVHLVVGFGALAVGTWVGVQWLVDGLRAGYPFLALIGAGVIAAGVVVDLIAYFLIPGGRGRSRLVIALGPWHLRLAGVDPVEAERLCDAVAARFSAPSAPPDDPPGEG